MQHHKLRFLKLSVVVCFFLTAPLFALSTDREKPIQIEADSGKIDDLKGIAIYEGNVVITQGTIEILADKVTLNYTDRQDIDQVVAEGGPARFKQLPDDSEVYLRASANTMSYFAAQNTLELQSNARVWKGEDVVTGQKIRYDTVAGVIRAFSGSERVKVLITPQRDDN